MLISAYATGDNISILPSPDSNWRVCHTTMQRMAQRIRTSNKIAWTAGGLQAAHLQCWAILQINCKAILAQDPKSQEEIGQQSLNKPTLMNYSGTQMSDHAQHHPTQRSRATTVISEWVSPFQKVMGKGEEESFETGATLYCSPSYQGPGRSTTPAAGLS